MTEKIEWYKEIMELEPNSKVFFPLAKLLVDENDAMQAIKVLEKGLERHPDFMEARLFLIELMYRNGLAEECAKQVQKLSSLLARYAGFWQAWAACLSASPGEADTASIVRFLAAHFLVGPLQINEVLNLGLAEIVKKYQKNENKDSTASAFIKKDEDAEPLPDNEIISHVKLQKNVAPQENELVEETLETAESVTVPEKPETNPASIGAAVNLETLPSVDFDNSDKAEDSPAEPFANAAPSPIQDTLPSAPEMAEKDETVIPLSPIGKDTLPGDESFSLRTRSMAEVLSDQGDYKGALEIYEELAASEKNPEDAENMQRRMEELRALINIRPNPVDEPIQMDPPAQKKERLLGILESLAKRVEARIHT